MYNSKVLRGVKKIHVISDSLERKKMIYNNPELSLMIYETMKIPSHYIKKLTEYKKKS